MDFKNILLGLASKTVKIDNGKLDELLSSENATEETVLNALLELDINRVAELKKAADTSKFQEGYAKAKKEERSAFEKEIKDKFKVDVEDTGLSLIEKIVAANKTAGSGSKEITEDDVKKHKSYQDLLDSMNNKIQSTNTEWETKYNELQKNYSKAGIVSKVKTMALSELEAMKPILPKNAQAATNLKNIFTGVFDSFDYEEQDGRTLILENGKLKEDSHGNRVELKDFIKQTANSYFDFQENNGGSNGANGGNGSGGSGSAGGNGGGGASYTSPKTLEDLTAIIDNKEISLQDKEKAIKEFEALGK